MQIPFLDLKAHHQPHLDEFRAAIEQVLASNAFAGGPFVASFEKEFAPFCGCREAIGLGSGTEALWLSLLAMDIGPGDEVITVPMTFMATAEAISYCGAKPVLVDNDLETYTMDPTLLERAITPRTKAIIPVHLFGQTADMDPIIDIAKRHQLKVIEDACQAHGASYRERPAGSLADAGCFSFYPGKNLGAFGEAGAVVTNDASLAERIRALRDHGQTRKYHHTWIGWNCRMDGIQGAVLSVKLKRLHESNLARRRAAQLYGELLAGMKGVVLPQEADYAFHVYHIYAVRVKDRDQLLQKLAARGVNCGIHYPVPIHMQKAYDFLGLKAGAFPVAERCAEEFLSLPMFPELTAEQIKVVARELEACLN